MSDYMQSRRMRKLGLSEPLPTKKEKKRIPKVSVKRTELNLAYQKQSKDFLASRPMCEIKAPGCTHKATGIHHKAGRIGKMLMNALFWMAACNRCNLWVEENDAEARRLGLKVSKHR